MLETIACTVFCLITRLSGIDRRIGFVGTSCIALVTIPLSVLVITGPSRRFEWRQRTRTKRNPPAGHFIPQ
jgi:hypothetical protein